MEILFAVLLFLSVYSYLVYPALLALISRKAKNPPFRSEISPSISIVLSLYNEEKVIEEKIRNSLALVYPGDRLEIIVCSDGSTDRTDEIMAAMKDPRITFRPFPERSGKTACLNRIIPGAKGEIILFTDANSMFPPDLLTRLVRNFASPEIGLVTGWTRYGGRSGERETTGIYSRLEKWTREKESAVSSCVGADGAIFAMRKSLFRPLSDSDINDFVLPLRVIEQGRRVVLDPGVFCFEEPSGKTGGEYRRQVRISTRTLGALRRNAGLLNPFRYGVFSFFLISHKVMRFLVPFLLPATLGINIALLDWHAYHYILPLLAQILFFSFGGLSAAGLCKGRVGECIRLFLLTAAAQLVGWGRMAAGTTDTVWRTER